MGTTRITTHTIRTYTAGILTGAIITLATILATPTAKAEPTNTEIAYTQAAAPIICNALDNQPTLTQMTNVVVAVMADGWDGYRAGEIVGLAIADVCPRYVGLALAWVDAVSGNGKEIHSKIGGAVA